MAAIHVLTGDGGKWSVAMHIAIPNENNVSDVGYRTALIASGIGGTTQLADGDGNDGTISGAEKALIETGEVYEHVGSFPVESGGTTTAQLRASLRKFYGREKVSVIKRLQAKLRFYGHTESEA